MSDDPTREEVLASVEPKSDQLNADDLLSGPLTVTITKVSRGDREQPIVISVDGHRPYKPCKTMRRVLIAAFTDDPKAWIGKQMTLFCDPTVTWAGVRVGGIRISHLSGIDEPKTFLLTQTRGKRAEVTILPLATSSADQAYIDDVRAEIARAETSEQLHAIGFILKNKPKSVQDAVRQLYVQRKNELGL